MEQVISLIGIVCMIGIAWLCSTNRRRFNVRIVFGGVALQFILAAFILKTPWGLGLFGFLQDLMVQLVNYSDEGAKFLFGEKFAEHFFAFKVLPTIIFISSLSYVLFHLGIIQRLVRMMAFVMQKTMGVSGVESLVTAANVFVGQTEAPLFIAPYIRTMTRSEIMTMMTGGMATVAGGVMAAYVGLGISAGHLVAASIMSAPAAILIAKIMVPEIDQHQDLAREAKTSTVQSDTIEGIDLKTSNVLDAACQGAAEGLKLCLNVGAMLIAFLALIALVDGLLGWVSGLLGYPLELKVLLGWIFRPLAFIMGVSWQDSYVVGQMLGTKIVFNEFVAYLQLGEILKQSTSTPALEPRSVIIATYALCGFANFSSIAIQIGGIGSIEPSQKSVFASLGLRAMIGGSLAAFMTACIAGVLI